MISSSTVPDPDPMTRTSYVFATILPGMFPVELSKFARVTSRILMNPIDEPIMTSKQNLMHGGIIELKLIIISLMSPNLLPTDIY